MIELRRRSNDQKLTVREWVPEWQDAVTSMMRKFGISYVGSSWSWADDEGHMRFWYKKENEKYPRDFPVKPTVYLGDGLFVSTPAQTPPHVLALNELLDLLYEPVSDVSAYSSGEYEISLGKEPTFEVWGEAEIVFLEDE